TVVTNRIGHGLVGLKYVQELHEANFRYRLVHLREHAESVALFHGPSGCGKSTFLRTIAGIWPYGCGTITIPLHDTTMFLPQRPYCPLGSLRQCLTYPSKCLSSKNDHNINRLLHKCHLESLCCYNLDDIQDWSRILSLGEQQKMSFVRIFLHRPKWIFLDEATSSLDQQTEAHLYSTLFDELGDDTTVISVGHRTNLRRFHKVEMIFLNKQINIVSLTPNKF
ncbi:unnamed protein product, partial [Rotaria sp. Silwood1]